jgi:hypothetical protein
MLNLF